jgi:hypothetical protein
VQLLRAEVVGGRLDLHELVLPGFVPDQQVGEAARVLANVAGHFEQNYPQLRYVY